MRMTKSIIKDLVIFLIGFGVTVGLIFPFFTLIMGVEQSIALSPIFFFACISAGALVGSVNVLLIKKILINRLIEMTNKMDKIKNNVIDVAMGDFGGRCELNSCQIQMHSEDAIGENIKTYNHLVEALSLSMSGELLVSHLNKNNIVKKALPQFLEETNSIAGAIFIEQEGELKLIGSSGLKNPDNLNESKIILSVANSGLSSHLKLPSDILIDGMVLDIRPSEVLAEPLLFNGVRIGVLLLATVENFHYKEFEKIKILKKSLSLALHNAEIHEQIQKLAAIDPLTSIYNRRFGLKRLKDEYNRSLRSNTPLGVIIFDLDHFKRVNDTYGHLAGDKVLASISKLIKNSLREEDVVIRYGGEEFLAVLPSADKENTFMIAEKIRINIKNHIIHYGSRDIKITISMGMTSIPENRYSDHIELISAIDEALYASKQHGRNKVTIAKSKKSTH